MYSIFYITAPNEGIGRKIAQLLVEEKLAACVTIIPAVISCYRWNGKIETGAECLLMGKTTESLAQAIKNRVSEIHPYDVPEILFVNIANGLESYLQWVGESVSS
ncbi:divalent-cation tolerance protein CutA [bacterium]|nr:divalent-cation tolerance protein CutA [bacterium]